MYVLKNLHWKSSGIIIFWCKYYIVILDTLVSSFSNMLFFLLAVLLSELHEKPRRNKDWVTQKCTKKNLCEGHYYFECTSSSLCHFYCFLSLLPSSSQLTYLLNGPIKIHNIAMGVGILCDDFMSFFYNNGLHKN